MSTLPFLDPDLDGEARIDDLLSRMTLHEKIACLGERADVPRLGVTGTLHIEGYHGLALGGPSNWGRLDPTPTTQFPQAYGLGATWDPESIRQVAAQLAEEARYLAQCPRYRRAGLVLRAPNADLARDPRWGRTEEVYGEDPFHAGTLARAFVKGLHGEHPTYWTVASLLKHFVANSHERDRYCSSSNFDERLMHEYYAKPFEMAVADGGAQAIMAAYNAVNDIPAHVHPILRELVVDRWGLDGIICTDAGGLVHLVESYKIFPDLPTAVAACLRAGINHFIDKYQEALTVALERRLCTEENLDRALRGVFRVMLRLGLLDPPERVPQARIGVEGGGDLEPWRRPETRALVRRITQQSIVLLKNSAGLLPLNRASVDSIAVVGPHVNQVLQDWYSGTPPYAISPCDGIERVAQGLDALSRVFDSVEEGVGVGWVAGMGDSAVELARRSDVAVVCVGNHPEGNASWDLVSSPSEGKENVDRLDIVLDAAQEAFVRRVYEANPRTVVVLISGFPYALPWIAQHATTLLHVAHGSQELGTALADVLFGDVNPGGKLVQTWPKSVQQLPSMLDYDIRHGRTYQYFEGEPQFHFGYGASYTRFELCELTVSEAVLRGESTLTVQVNVANVGPRAGDEVVQLYVHHIDSKVDRPRRALKAFQRLTLGVGESRRITLTLSARDITHWSTAEQGWVLEAGRIEILVGTSSRDEDLKLRQIIEVAP